MSSEHTIFKPYIFVYNYDGVWSNGLVAEVRDQQGEYLRRLNNARHPRPPRAV